MAADRLKISKLEGIADMRLARPEKINALDHAMFAALSETITSPAANTEVRCTVLSGEGRRFCVGVDRSALSGDIALRDLARRTHGPANLFQNAAWGWRALPVPVIAAAHGFAFGGGMQIMLGADIRIAHPDTKLSMMEARWGLVPDVAGITLLRGLVRDDIAREIVFSARIFDGGEALRLGLVTRLAETPHDAATQLARSIAAASPDAVKAGKRLLNLSTDAFTAAILLAESIEQQALLTSPGNATALTAWARENGTK